MSYISIITKSEASTLRDELRRLPELTFRQRIDQLMSAAEKPCTIDAYLELVNSAIHLVAWLPESEKCTVAKHLLDRLGIKNFQLRRECVDYHTVLCSLICDQEKENNWALYLERVHWNTLAWRVGNHSWPKQARANVGYRNRKSLVNRHVFARTVVL